MSNDICEDNRNVQTATICIGVSNHDKVFKIANRILYRETQIQFTKLSPGFSLYVYFKLKEEEVNIKLYDILQML